MSVEELKKQLLEATEGIAEKQAKMAKRIDAQDEARESSNQDFEKASQAVDSFGESLLESQKQIKEITDALNEEITGIKTRQSEFEAENSTPGAGDGDVKESPGEIFAKSAQLALARENGVKVVNEVKYEGRVWNGFAKGAAMTTDDYATIAQALAGVNRLPEQDFIVRSLLTSGIATTNSIKYIEETYQYNWYSQVASGGAAGASTVVLDKTDGLFAGQTITMNPDDAATKEDVVISSISTVTVTIVGTFSYTHDADDVVASAYFDGTAISGTIPDAKVITEKKTANVENIKSMIQIPEEALEDSNVLRMLVDNELRRALARTEEYQLLYGSGSSNQVQGMLSNSNVQTLSKNNGQPNTTTDLDTLRTAMTMLFNKFMNPDGMLLHPTNKLNIDIEKGTDGHYIWAKVVTANGNMVWGLPIHQSASINVGTAAVGAFKYSYWLMDRKGATIAVTDSHASNFADGIQAMRITERIATVPMHADGIVKVTL